VVQTSIQSGEWITFQPAETFRLGETLGNQLIGGEVLLLSGPLGAGKTILVKGIASSLGIAPEDVTSPTFSLVNPYRGRLTLYHLDLYRLEAGVAAARAVDLDEILSDSNAVVVIEWADRLGRYPLPGTTWIVTISGDGDDPRQIKVAPS